MYVLSLLYNSICTLRRLLRLLPFFSSVGLLVCFSAHNLPPFSLETEELRQGHAGDRQVGIIPQAAGGRGKGASRDPRSTGVQVRRRTTPALLVALWPGPWGLHPAKWHADKGQPP